MEEIELTKIDRIKMRINRGLTLSAYRGLLERNKINTCFYCDKIEYKTNLKKVKVKASLIAFACDYCINKRHIRVEVN